MSLRRREGVVRSFPSKISTMSVWYSQPIGSPLVLCDSDRGASAGFSSAPSRCQGTRASCSSRVSCNRSFQSFFSSSVTLWLNFSAGISLLLADPKCVPLNVSPRLFDSLPTRRRWKGASSGGGSAGRHVDRRKSGRGKGCSSRESREICAASCHARFFIAGAERQSLGSSRMKLAEENTTRSRVDVIATEATCG
jgi:hypothetical protein